MATVSAEKPKPAEKPKKKWHFPFFKNKKSSPPPPTKSKSEPVKQSESDQSSTQTATTELPIHRGVRVNTRQLVALSGKDRGTQMGEARQSFLEHLEKFFPAKSEVSVVEDTAVEKERSWATAVEDDLSNYRHMRLNAKMDRALACGPSRDPMLHRGLEHHEHPAVALGVDVPVVALILNLIEADSITEQSSIGTLQSQSVMGPPSAATVCTDRWTVMSQAGPSVAYHTKAAQSKLNVSPAQLNQVMERLVEKGDLEKSDVEAVKEKITARATARGDQVQIQDVQAVLATDTRASQLMSIRTRSQIKSNY